MKIDFAVHSGDYDLKDSSTATMTSVSQLAKENMQRCAEILECQEKIRFYQSRLNELQQEHREIALVASLKADACSTWNDMREDEKCNKEHILAALQSEADLPFALCERNWESSVPAPLRYDTDLFLARLEREDFRLQHLLLNGDSLMIPPQLQTDKEVVLKVLQVYPAFLKQRENGLSPVLLDDFEFACACLRLDTKLFAENANEFSESIRNSPELMLKALEAIEAEFSQSVGNSVFKGPMCLLLSNLGSHLRADRNFMLQAVDVVSRLPSDALEHLPPRLRADKTIVLAFVGKNGKNLADASPNLRRDMEVVRVACAQDPAALCYCLPGRTKQLLTSNKQYVLELLRGGAQSDKVPKGVFDICSPQLKKDRDVVIAAVTSKSLAISDIPEAFETDEMFWKYLVLRMPRAWCFSMPPTLQQDRDFAIIAAQNIQDDDDEDTDAWVEDILWRHPGVADNRQVAENIVRLKSLRDISVLFSANAALARNREMVLQACRTNGSNLGYVHDSLLDDRNIIQAALDSDPDALFCLPHPVQQLFPDLVAQAIRNPEFADWDEFFATMNEELWENREIALAWASKGGEYMDKFPDAFAEDKGLFLMFAEHSWEEFEYASEALRGDKDFMLQVVEKQGRLLRQAHGQLSQDFDLALVALAGTDHMCDYHHTTTGGVCGCFQFLTDFATKVRSRLYSHEGFVKGILCGMTLEAAEDTLAILNQGQETSLAYKMQVAEFSGIPMGKELRLLRQASTNLERWGY